jgi:hypothetical protein
VADEEPRILTRWMAARGPKRRHNHPGRVRPALHQFRCRRARPRGVGAGRARRFLGRRDRVDDPLPAKSPDESFTDVTAATLWKQPRDSALPAAMPAGSISLSPDQLRRTVSGLRLLQPDDGSPASCNPQGSTEPHRPHDHRGRSAPHPRPGLQPHHRRTSSAADPRRPWTTTWKPRLPVAAELDWSRTRPRTRRRARVGRTSPELCAPSHLAAVLTGR